MIKSREEIYRGILFQEFDLEVHLGKHLYPDRKIDWSRLELLDGHRYSSNPPLPLFRDDTLNELERLTLETQEEIIVEFDSRYRISLRSKK